MKDARGFCFARSQTRQRDIVRDADAHWRRYETDSTLRGKTTGHTIAASLRFNFLSEDDCKVLRWVLLFRSDWQLLDSCGDVNERLVNRHRLKIVRMGH